MSQWNVLPTHDDKFSNFHARLELDHVQKKHSRLSHLCQWKQLGGGVTPNGDYYAYGNTENSLALKNVGSM